MRHSNSTRGGAFGLLGLTVAWGCGTGLNGSERRLTSSGKRTRLVKSCPTVLLPEIAMRTLALTIVSLLLLACAREPAAPDMSVPSFAATSDWTDQVVNLPPGDVKRDVLNCHAVTETSRDRLRRNHGVMLR